ncbi:MAG: hypothetical protein QNK24_04625, partial [Desulfuromusa sp.]|nr:hypothetical protein [Desulfuromusa sp.]
AVFWYATIYLRSGLCANPTESLIQNIGLDGSGVNCITGVEHMAGGLSQKTEFKFQSKIEENTIAFNRILSFYDESRRPLMLRVWRRLKHLFE